MRDFLYSNQTRLFTFFFTTAFGSALSSIAILLSVEQGFKKLTFLGAALAAKTLACAIFSTFVPKAITHLGLRNSFIASQLSGFLALTITGFGFHCHSFSLFILGVMLTGLPSSFLAVLMTMTLRLINQNEANFRKTSGHRELLNNTALLLSAIAAPLLLWKYDLYIVLIIDAGSFVLGLILFKYITLPIYQENTKTDSKIRDNLLLKKETCIFLLKTSSSLLLAGLIPLLACSNSITLTHHLPTLLRQWLWVMETLVWIFSSLLYLYVVCSSKKPWLSNLLMCNAIWAIGFLFFKNPIAIIIIASSVSLLMSLSFQKFRDDYILHAEQKHEKIKSYSALANFQRNFVFFISPLLLSFLFQHVSYLIMFSVLILIQLILWAGLFVVEQDFFKMQQLAKLENS